MPGAPPDAGRARQLQRTLGCRRTFALGPCRCRRWRNMRHERGSADPPPERRRGGNKCVDLWTRHLRVANHESIPSDLEAQGIRRAIDYANARVASHSRHIGCGLMPWTTRGPGEPSARARELARSVPADKLTDQHLTIWVRRHRSELTASGVRDDVRGWWRAATPLRGPGSRVATGTQGA